MPSGTQTHVALRNSFVITRCVCGEIACGYLCEQLHTPSGRDSIQDVARVPIKNKD